MAKVKAALVALINNFVSGWMRRALFQSFFGMTAIGGGAGEVTDIIDVSDVPPAPVVVDLSDQLPGGDYPLRTTKPTTLVIHHTATTGQGWGTIAEFHIRVNEWKAIGYAYGTSWDGKRFILNDPLRKQNHTRDKNSSAAGMAMLGNFHTGPLSDLHAQTTKDYARELSEFHGYRYIVPHQYFSRTACPGDYAMGKLSDLWITPPR